MGCQFLGDPRGPTGAFLPISRPDLSLTVSLSIFRRFDFLDRCGARHVLMTLMDSPACPSSHALPLEKSVGTHLSVTFCAYLDVPLYMRYVETDTFLSPLLRPRLITVISLMDFPWHAPAERLPPSPDGEWWEMIDEVSGLPYYYQTKTGETVWERPDAFVIPLGILQVSCYDSSRP